MFSWATKKKSENGKGIGFVLHPLNPRLIYSNGYMPHIISSGTDRKSQLEEFKAMFPAHRRPNNDDSIIEVVFSCQSDLAILRS